MKVKLTLSGEELGELNMMLSGSVIEFFQPDITFKIVMAVLAELYYKTEVRLCKPVDKKNVTIQLSNAEAYSLVYILPKIKIPKYEPLAEVARFKILSVIQPQLK